MTRILAAIAIWLGILGAGIAITFISLAGIALLGALLFGGVL